MGNFCRWLCCIKRPIPPQTNPIIEKTMTSTILIVGNVAVGKTSLIECFKTNKSRKGEEVRPTITLEDHIIKRENPKTGEKIILKIRDLAGNNNAESLIRDQPRISYIILCYSIDKKTSYEGLDDWLEAINSVNVGKKAPIALVCTKNDLERVISYDMGNNMRDYINE